MKKVKKEKRGCKLLTRKAMKKMKGGLTDTSSTVAAGSVWSLGKTN